MAKTKTQSLYGLIRASLEYASSDVYIHYTDRSPGAHDDAQMEYLEETLLAAAKSMVEAYER